MQDRLINFDIPTMPMTYPDIPKDYPISQRENLMRALNHEKPLYMPILETASQFSPMYGYGDIPPTLFADGTDWFGVFYKFTEAQGTSTPMPGMFAEVGEWREKVKWPDFETWDWEKGKDEFFRDENLALFMQFGYGTFEKLHTFEGFEQAFMDLLLEPEECRAFFDRMVDHKIEVFKRMDAVYNYDYVIYNDDWCSARGPFFSMEVFENTILEPTIRHIKAFKDAGKKVIFHTCGLMNNFAPYFAERIKPDGIQIQHINNIDYLIKAYGDKLSINFYPDEYILYNPVTTPDDAREYARELVDKYGAHVNPGSGLIAHAWALREEVYHAFTDEIFTYSLEKYKGL